MFFHFELKFESFAALQKRRLNNGAGSIEA